MSRRERHDRTLWQLDLYLFRLGYRGDTWSELAGVPTGQVVCAELINSGINNAANWLFVDDAISVDSCLGGEFIQVPNTYRVCL